MGAFKRGFMKTSEYPSLEGESRRGIFELLSIAGALFRNNPALSVPPLVAFSVYVVQSTAAILTFFYMVENFLDFEVLKGLIKGGNAASLIPEFLSYVSFFLKSYVVVLFVTRVLSRALYSMLLYPYAFKLLRGEKTSLFEHFKGSLSYFKKLFTAALVVESIAVGLPTLILILVLDRFLEIIQMGLAEGFVPEVFFNAKNIAVTLMLIASFLLLVLIALIFEFLFTFVFQIIVVENLSLVAAIAKSAILVAKNFVSVMTYIILQFLLVLIAVLITLLFQLFSVEVSGVMQLVVIAVLSPILDVMLFGVYLQSVGYSITPTLKPIFSFTETFLKVFNKGLATLKKFISLRNMPYIASSAFLYFLGFLLGLEYSRGPLGEFFSLFLTPEKIGLTAQALPSASLSGNVFAHNWQVSILTSLSGILTFVLPAANCLFNGIILGLAYGLISPTTFIVGVLPHGVIELPSFLIAASSGLKLGYYMLARREEAGKVLRETVYLLVGLAPFFLIAALVEVLITPQLLKLIELR